jgi:UPF0042 nucleotide-binding protein
MTRPLRLVLVSGLSGAGKVSVLRALEDIGFEAVDNPPLGLLDDMVRQARGDLAVGVDARTAGFDAEAVLHALARLRADPHLAPELIYVWAEEAVLLRRYSETRRRHPLSPEGRVADGIAHEQALTGRLREAADLVLDTSDLPLPAMRAAIEARYGGADAEARRLAVTLVSFSYARGLPRDADLVFDARFLRNPHYDPILRPLTGIDREVAAYVESDPDFPAFWRILVELLGLLLPRFVQEGKKYVTVAVGCTGGRHRSVHIVEKLAKHLAAGASDADPRSGFRLHVTHRELSREGAPDSAAGTPVQAQEA